MNLGKVILGKWATHIDELHKFRGNFAPAMDQLSCNPSCAKALVTWAMAVSTGFPFKEWRWC
jgi:hypothetical protein